ncbi:hypothetical protein GCM10025867_27090 [Frondihabitans sucicola]|uniref:Uncharacterized protein n=1 Tax=Frondihabitans sucicola TaxID=1268041 RepID=A0ABN6Y405_9MICO|nr:hypothetical protein GCM10025867_27090 [Frondihabitans sucicola]
MVFFESWATPAVGVVTVDESDRSAAGETESFGVSGTGFALARAGRRPMPEPFTGIGHTTPPPADTKAGHHPKVMPRRARAADA